MTIQEAAAPLEGLRVVELAGAPGQYLGKLLGDMGADVVDRAAGRRLGATSWSIRGGSPG